MKQTSPLIVTGRDGTQIEVPVRISARARRLSLKVDPARGMPELVLPHGVAPTQAESFVARNVVWLEERLKRLPEPIAFADGTIIPLLGTEHLIRHRPELRGTVRRFDGNDGEPARLEVSGGADHLARRLTDWLKREARGEISARARHYAERLDRRPSRISIRDTRSRWGSCSSKGALSFSWRLILAPEHVLDYVCAHEAAHLIEMNHSHRFWALVEKLVEDMDMSRAWLKRHGATLHRYG
ncbi:M48 family metallopeptidase [Nisaea acidiphila]|uniref:M48 family metallopeptidase n=1 Tax=Nisaea acidiphila TaxID=1862145 RepID=A0A9J7AXG4_9PROT|nr:SprT family zinc-dependent metalloprotease [Nisaea acidiphila]UUX52079.1 M48 family metallopeptidase [Nisaea acidiphila]